MKEVYVELSTLVDALPRWSVGGFLYTRTEPMMFDIVYR